MYRLQYSLKTAFLVFFISLFFITAKAQEPTKSPTPAPTEDDVVKIETNLIQTGVIVTDQKGQLIENLKAQDFELKVDGKTTEVPFFEAVFNSRQTEIKPNPNQPNKIIDTPLNVNNHRGRTILFLVDDLHLSFESHKRVRDLITNFIDKDLQENDVLAVVSATGKIGFLQQFTDDKLVMKKAIDRLIYNRDYSATDRLLPPMSEYEAMLIERLDPEVTDIFAEYIVKEYPGSSMETARAQVRTRAGTILFQGRVITQKTINVLEQAIRRSAEMPGRKIVFLLSDGFLIDQSTSDNSYELKKIIDAAARTNSVIYSFDVKGLEAGFPEGTSAENNRTAYRVQSGSRFEMQDGLSTLAENTGGRFIYNNNDLKTPASKAVVEASGYYLLAWEPEEETNQNDKLRKIEVAIKGRPDLKVRLQSGYLSQTVKKIGKPQLETKTVSQVNSEDSQLINAVNSLTNKSELPTSMVLNYLEMPGEGAVLSGSLQIKNEFLDFTKELNRSFAKVDFLGVVYNTEGKAEGSFKDRITVNYQPESQSGKELPDMFHNFRFKLKPGLYQVRVAAREVKSGLIGNINRWINIPDLSNKKLAVSSLLLGERKIDGKNQNTYFENSPLEDTEISVNRIFPKTSLLRYLIFIYNSSKNSGDEKPDLTVQTQLFREGRLILDSPAKQISVEEQNSEQIFYGAEIPLNYLSPGSYQIQLIINDKIGKTSASQKVKFQVK